MRDDAHPVDPEQRRTTVFGVIELPAEAAERRLQQQPTSARTQIMMDLPAKNHRQELDHALRELEDDVAGEAVADHDIGSSAKDVAALHVADEVEPRLLREQRVTRLSKFVPLRAFLADVQEADPRLLPAENVLGVDRAHDRELDHV